MNTDSLLAIDLLDGYLYLQSCQEPLFSKNLFDYQRIQKLWSEGQTKIGFRWIRDLTQDSLILSVE